jgi:hypothetical protein|nr:MAG TPA: hypothetical protein [Caudoviricetes sp.]
MSEPKLIKKYLLDKSLTDELDDKPSKSLVRLKSEPITLDDVNDVIRNKLNNIGSPGGTAYDDAELRNRVVSLETDHLPKNDVFVKSRDKVSLANLDTDLTLAHTYALKVPSLETNKADKNYVDSTFRRADHPIESSDLEPNLSSQILGAISDVHALTLQNNTLANSAATINEIKSDIATLKSTTVGKSEMNSYRLKTEVLGVNEVSSEIRDSVAKLPNIEKQLVRKLDEPSANNIYRRKDTAIVLDDLERDFASLVRTTIASASGVRDAALSVVKDYFEHDGRQWVLDTLGHPQNKNEDDSDLDLLHYIGPIEFARAVTDWNQTTGTGFATVNFSTCLNYLWAQIKEMKSQSGSVSGTITSIKSDITSLKSDVTSIKNDIKKIKEDITAIKAKYPVP